MGIIFSRHKRVFVDELQDLQYKQESLEEEIRNKISSKDSINRFCGFALLFSVLLSIGISYFRVKEKRIFFLYSFSIVITGTIVLYGTRCIVSEIFNWCVRRKRYKRDRIRERKHEILEKVKETETFKVAREILQRFDEPSVERSYFDSKNSFRAVSTTFTSDGKKFDDSAGSVPIGSSCQQSPHRTRPRLHSNTQQLPKNQEEFILRKRLVTTSDSASPEFVKPARNPPRPFVQQSRTVGEKFIDLLFGDSPNGRYALICGHCNEHNGLAKEEEFDYLSYRCWACNEFNPARRQHATVTLPNVEPKSSYQAVKCDVASSVNEKSMQEFSDKNSQIED